MEIWSYLHLQGGILPFECCDGLVMTVVFLLAAKPELRPRGVLVASSSALDSRPSLLLLLLLFLIVILLQLLVPLLTANRKVG